jgi:23S rRNA-/tRNA-specific pseudouridylate synthase
LSKDKRRSADNNAHKPKRRPYEIVHEDPYLLVVNKAAGILTVPIPGKRSRNVQELL